MNCEQIHPLLTRHLLGDLDADTAKDVAAHIAACEVCQSELRLLEPTLALLGEALSEPVGAHRLTTRRREQILHPKRTPRAIQWASGHHPQLAVAAGLLFVFGSLWILKDSLTSRTAAVRTVSVRCAEPERLDELDEVMEVPVDVAAPPDPVSLGYSYDTVLSAGDTPTPRAAPPQEFSPQPAEFDAVTMVKSPLIMKGVHGSRQTGARGQAIRRHGGRATPKPTTKKDRDSDALGALLVDGDDLELRISDAKTPPMSELSWGGSSGGQPDGNGARDDKAAQGIRGAKPIGGSATIGLTGEDDSGTTSPRAKWSYGKGDSRIQEPPCMKPKKARPSVSLTEAEERVRSAEDALVEHDRLHDIARVEARGSMESRYAEALATRKTELYSELANLEADAAKPVAVDRDRSVVSAFHRSVASLGDSGPAGSELAEESPEERANALRKAVDSIEAAEYKWQTRSRLQRTREEEKKRLKENVQRAEATYLDAYEANLRRNIAAKGRPRKQLLAEAEGALLSAKNELTDYERLHSTDFVVDGELSSVPARDRGLLVSTEAKEAAVYERQAKKLMNDAREAQHERLGRKLKRAEAAYRLAIKVDRETSSEEAAPVADTEEDSGKAYFKAVGVNAFLTTSETPFSTFAIDVDTAAYTLGRNYLRQGLLPPAESVRTEEYVNFFDYAYKAPTRETFAVYADVAPSAFGHGLHLMRIGIKGRRLGREEQRRASLTFLIDTSGSMNQPDRLKLVQSSLELLVGKMKTDDLVAIVQYDSHASLVLEHTRAEKRDVILKAIKSLQCGGSTNLEEGMHRAYELAAANFIPKGENRVLLLSDGVANLGSGAAEDILAKVDTYRRQGITCSVFGFGMGTYDDTMLETLANKGDGAYAFIDSNEEARRVFVDDLSGTLNTIAADVKIQAEYRPTHVARYRQLGYENRQLRKQDFRNDAVDAGEVGSGQSVTALYELALNPIARPEPYSEEMQSPRNDVIATVRVRYRRIDTGVIEEIEHRVRRSDILPRFEAASSRFRLGAAVAEFSEILRGSPFAAGSTTDDVAAVLRPVALDMPLDGYVQELLRIVDGAKGMGRGK